MSKRSVPTSEKRGINVPLTVIAALLVIVGIAWVVMYDVKGIDGKPGWMADLGDWNWLVGFGLIIVGLIVASGKGAPLGHGRGVVIGMLGCFILGLIWIVVYYFTSNVNNFPLLSNLGQWNLGVGIGFIAAGFVFATKWE